MAESPVRIGLVGAGANTKAKHIPGFRAIPGVEIVAVCNRRIESTSAAAKEFAIPRTYLHWQDLVCSPEIDAVVIGTWPYLHCPITLAALEAGKHVLTEARMSMNASEAHQMRAAARRSPKLVTQIVPSPYGLRGHDVMSELLDAEFIGPLREMHVYGLSGHLAGNATPLTWRQDAALSGFNMLTLGIVHETVARWVAPVTRVQAQVHAFVPSRIDPESGVRRVVGTPDSVQILTRHEDGMHGLYHFSGVAPFAPGMGVRLFGADGAIWYDFTAERIQAARLSQGDKELRNIPIPEAKARTWTVEADFIQAIRHGSEVRFTDFDSGVSYMEFTEAVARSAQSGQAIELPLGEFAEARESSA